MWDQAAQCDSFNTSLKANLRSTQIPAIYNWHFELSIQCHTKLNLDWVPLLISYALCTQGSETESLFSIFLGIWLGLSPTHAVNGQVIDHAIKVWRAQMWFYSSFDWLTACVGEVGWNFPSHCPVSTFTECHFVGLQIFMTFILTASLFAPLIHVFFHSENIEAANIAALVIESFHKLTILLDVYHTGRQTIASYHCQCLQTSALLSFCIMFEIISEKNCGEHVNRWSNIWARHFDWSWDEK